MLLLTDALKIAIFKVLESILNIFVFRNVYGFFREILGGFLGFVCTVYLTNKVRQSFKKNFKKVREANAVESGRVIFKFDLEGLKTIDLDKRSESETVEKFNLYAKSNSQSDLFNCVFSASSQSGLISLLTILGVEHLCSKDDLPFIVAILYCVSTSFFLCFGSSFKYTRMLIADWLTGLVAAPDSDEKKPENQTSSKLNKILMTHTNPLDKSVEFVGLWLSKYDSHRNTVKVELRFLRANYLDYIKEVFEYYANNHMKLEKNDENSKVEKYEFYVPDYYNGGGYAKIFEKAVKERGFESQESWTEFRIFPGVNFNINVFVNTGKKKLKSN